MRGHLQPQKSFKNNCITKAHQHGGQLSQKKPAVHSTTYRWRNRLEFHFPESLSLILFYGVYLASASFRLLATSVSFRLLGLDSSQEVLPENLLCSLACLSLSRLYCLDTLLRKSPSIWSASGFTKAVLSCLLPVLRSVPAGGNTAISEVTGHQRGLSSAASPRSRTQPFCSPSSEGPPD